MNPYSKVIQDFIDGTKTYIDAHNDPGKVEHVVDPIFPMGALILLAGASGAIKTSAMINAGIDIAAGVNFLKLPTKQAPVLMIDEEMGEHMLRPKIAETGLGVNVTRDIPFYWHSYAGVNFTNSAEVKKWENIIRGAIDHYKAEVVFIDSLHRTIPGKNDSKIEDVTPMLDTLLRITRDLGVTIILIHHWNKTGSWRGSTAILGMVDMLINVIKKGNNVTFEIDKNRFGPSGLRFDAVADWSNGKFTLTGKATQPPKKKPLAGLKLHIVGALRNLGGTGTINEIVEEFKNMQQVYEKASVKNTIYKLGKDKLVFRINPGGKGVEAEFILYEALTPMQVALDPETLSSYEGPDLDPGVIAI